MLTLYHYDRSTAAQRVRLTLEEKGLPWKSIIVDTARGDIGQLPENYHKLNPKGLIPVLVDGEKAIPESLIIQEYLEDRFPSPSFRSEDPFVRTQMRLWTRRIDEAIHVASRVVGVCIVNRHIYKEAEKGRIETYYNSMRDTVRRENDQANIKHGLDSPLLGKSVRAFRNLFEEMDNWLEKRTWLDGDNYSLADMALVVYVRRLESFMMAPLWQELASLNDWYQRIAQRPAYERAIVAWGDVTEAARVEHGKAAFAKIQELWSESESPRPET
jgi:glutathione S-transferase